MAEVKQMPDASGDERTRRHMVGLIGAHLFLALFAVLLFSEGFQGYKWPRWQSIFAEALACSQVGFMAAILAIGNMRLSVRIISAAIVLTFWLIVLDALDLGHENWLAIFAIQFAGIGITLAVPRIFGFQLVREQNADEGPVESAQYRFSLRQMLLLTAAVSFLLGLWTVASHFWGLQPSHDRGVRPRAMTLGLGLIPVMLAALWASLGTKRRILPIFVLVLVAALAGLATGRTDRLWRTLWWSSLSRESYEIAYWYLVGLYAFVVYLSLLVLRVSGYRYTGTRS